MKADLDKSIPESPSAPHENDGGLGDTIACGMLFLGVPSLAVIALMMVLVGKGVNPVSIEKGMVWLSVPWFALCYAMCRIADGMKFVVVDSGPNKAIVSSSQKSPADH